MTHEPCDAIGMKRGSQTKLPSAMKNSQLAIPRFSHKGTYLHCAVSVFSTYILFFYRTTVHMNFLDVEVIFLYFC